MEMWTRVVWHGGRALDACRRRPHHNRIIDGLPNNNHHQQRELCAFATAKEAVNVPLCRDPNGHDPTLVHDRKEPLDFVLGKSIFNRDRIKVNTLNKTPNEQLSIRFL